MKPRKYVNCKVVGTWVDTKHHNTVELLVYVVSNSSITLLKAYTRRTSDEAVLAILLFRYITYRSSHPEVFLRKGTLKICKKYTGEHPYRSVISIKFLCNFIEIALRHGCSPVNLLHIFRTPFPKNTAGWLLVYLTRYPNTMADKGFNLFAE